MYNKNIQVIISALLYSMEQAVGSGIDVVSCDSSPALLYETLRAVCKENNISIDELRDNSWFSELTWSACEEQYKELVWTRLVAKYCNCHPDAVGNMPCDNGYLCDRCRFDTGLNKAFADALNELSKDK